MFEHEYEKDVASAIVDNYAKKKEKCDNNDGMRHHIGISFHTLKIELGIAASLKVDKDKVEIITDSSLNHLSDDTSVEQNGFVDCCPIITSDENKHELQMVKLIQTISILMSLEKNNYICLLEGTVKPKLDNKEIYEPTSIRNEEMVLFIKRLIESRIIPTTALLELSRHKYISEERRQYDEQVKFGKKSLKEAHKANIIAKKSIKIATKGNTIAIVVGIFAIIVTIFSSRCTSTLSDKSIREIGREIYLNTLYLSIP